MKKYIYSILPVLTITALLSACGGGGGGSQNASGDDAAPRAEITGKVYNETSINPLTASAQGGVFEQQDPVRSGQPIMVSVEVSNTGTSSLAQIRYEVRVKDALYAIQEHNVCKRCYGYGSGEACNTLWEDYTLTRSDCDDSTPCSSGYCIDTFADGLDCEHPRATYIENIPYVEGYWRATGEIPTLGPGERFTSQMGYTNENIDVGDHEATWTIYDRAGAVLNSATRIVPVTN